MEEEEEEKERNMDEEETNQLIDDVTADRLRVSSIFKGRQRHIVSYA